MVALAVVFALAVGAMWWGQKMATAPRDVTALKQQTDKQQTAKQQTAQASGKTLFKKYCIACHGAQGAGSANGPPLIHKVYEPSHHGDQSFYNAALNGARQHHWQFGDMPPVPGIKLAEVVAITKYIRAIQRANGIF
jgi:mono/diheme cytochrome c family protein